MNASQWTLDFQIIGESHRVIARNEGHVSLQEILACVPLAEGDCWHFQKFATLANHSFRQTSYGMEIWFSEEPVPLLEGANLEMWFPDVHHRPPVTLIKCEVLPHEIRWWIYHSF